MPAKGFVNSNFGVYFGGYDLSGWHDKLSFPMSIGEVEATAAGMTAKARLSGVFDYSMEHSGFFDADSAALDIDDVLWAAIGTGDNVLTLFMNGATAAQPAYITRAINLKYRIGDKVGGAFPFNGAAYAQGDPVVRGTIMQNGAIAASGNGTGRQLGAVAAGKYLYAAIHCTATTGTGDRSLTIKVQSDDNASFTSATDRISFTAITTAVGAQWATAVAGPITDDYWRLSFTKAGTTLSANIVGVIGIQ